MIQIRNELTIFFSLLKLMISTKFYVTLFSLLVFDSIQIKMGYEGATNFAVTARRMWKLIELSQ